MNRLRQMAVFAAVVDAGSMTGAARELGMTPSAVSQHVRQLEKETGVVLLRRSTRRLSLTEAGRAYYEGCAGMLAAARAAEVRLAELRDAPVGELSLSAPVGFAARHLAEALAPLLIAHRSLSLRLVVSDEALDPIAAQIDVAVRIGRQGDSRMVARPLALWEFLICASPAYLASRGVPAQPDDLVAHDWLLLLRLGQHATLDLTGASGERRRIRVAARIRSNNQLSLRHLALGGAGLSLQAEPEIAGELAAGRLVRVLPGWSLPPVGVFAVTTRRDSQPAKVRYAIEALRSCLGDPLAVTPAASTSPARRPPRERPGSRRPPAR